VREWIPPQRTVKPPITASKLASAVDATRRSGRLRNPDPIPIVRLAIAADIAATNATQEAIMGRGARSEKRVNDFVRQLERVPGAVADALSNARALAWSFYDADEALRIARATASGIHLRCQCSYQDGREMRPQVPRKKLIDDLERLDRRYVTNLRSLRRSTMGGRFDEPLTLAAEVTEAAHYEIAPLCKLAARAAASDDDRAAGVALRASDLARRNAALVAGAIVIDKRLRDKRRRKSTAEAARRASKTRRTPLNPNAARKTLRTSDKGKSLSMVAQLGRVQYVERPRKPYSDARIPGIGDLRVPHKNMRRAGVVGGSWVVAAGKVKVASGDKALEVEFEGPGQHRTEYFEDWMCDLARPAYDLYPSVLRMIWELPDPKVRGGGADLLSRIDRGARG
jgi:hypothetical protein